MSPPQSWITAATSSDRSSICARSPSPYGGAEYADTGSGRNSRVVDAFELGEQTEDDGPQNAPSLTSLCSERQVDGTQLGEANQSVSDSQLSQIQRKVYHCLHLMALDLPKGKSDNAISAIQSARADPRDQGKLSAMTEALAGLMSNDWVSRCLHVLSAEDEDSTEVLWEWKQMEQDILRDYRRKGGRSRAAQARTALSIAVFSALLMSINAGVVIYQASKASRS